jgi:hypothetical protein
MDCKNTIYFIISTMLIKFLFCIVKNESAKLEELQKIIDF